MVGGRSEVGGVGVTRPMASEGKTDEPGLIAATSHCGPPDEPGCHPYPPSSLLTALRLFAPICGQKALRFSLLTFSPALQPPDARLRAGIPIGAVHPATPSSIAVSWQLAGKLHSSEMAPARSLATCSNDAPPAHPPPPDRPGWTCRPGCRARWRRSCAGCVA